MQQIRPLFNNAACLFSVDFGFNCPGSGKIRANAKKTGWYLYYSPCRSGINAEKTNFSPRTLTQN